MLKVPGRDTVDGRVTLTARAFNKAREGNSIEGEVRQSETVREQLFVDR